MRGTVMWFNKDKGYGFIQREDGRGDVFVHVSALKGLTDLRQGQTVEFDLGRDRQGRPRAENVRIAASQ
jgi:CspA family cold shock protein